MLKKGGYEILPRQDAASDIKIRVWGRTLQEIFRYALKGFAVCVKPEIFSFTRRAKALVTRGTKELQSFSVEAVDINSLLVEFVSDVIGRSDMDNLVFTDVSFKKFGENFLEGELQGIKIDEFEKGIKSVSYQDVDIKKNPDTGFFETILVFDI